MKLRIILVLSLLMSISVRAGTITVSAAISLKDALAEIDAAYEKQGGDHIELVVGSSGELAAQIQQGAPVDLFISAAWKQVNELTKAGIADESTKKVIVKNSLVLV